MVNDDKLIDYLVSSGYDYDTDSDSWIHKDKGTEALITERTEFFGDKRSKRFLGFERAMTKPPVPGSYRAELRDSGKKIDELIDTIKSLKGMREAKSEDMLKEVKDDFSPIISRPTTVDKAMEVIEDNIRDKIRDIRTDTNFYGRQLREVKTQSDLDEIERKMGLIVDDRDRVRIDRILSGSRGKAFSRVVSIRDLREKARSLTADEARLGPKTVKSFAKRYGWDTKKDEDLEEVRTLLIDKGMTVSPPKGIRRIERFE